MAGRVKKAAMLLPFPSAMLLPFPLGAGLALPRAALCAFEEEEEGEDCRQAGQQGSESVRGPGGLTQEVVERPLVRSNATRDLELSERASEKTELTQGRGWKGAPALKRATPDATR